MSDNGNDIHKENGERRVVKDSANQTVYRGRSRERASLSFSYDKKQDAPAAKKADTSTRIFDDGMGKAETRVMERRVVADSENKDIVRDMREAAAREEAAAAAKPSAIDSVKSLFAEKKEEIKKARAEAAVNKLRRARAESAAKAAEEKALREKAAKEKAAEEKALKEKAAKKPAGKKVKYPGKQIKKQAPVQKKKPARIEAAAPKSAKTSGKTSAKKPSKKMTGGKSANKTNKPKKPSGPKTKKQKALAYFLAAVKVMLALFIIGGVAGGAYAAYTIANAPKIHPEKIYDTLEVSTHIYDDQGELISDLYYDENREIAKYDQLPDNLKNAFIAVEDKTFWEHNGFNFRRIFGAIWNSLTGGGEISGTSTITQQLARNVFLPEEKSIRSIKRKIIEMYYAREIEEVLSKEEILTAYLNTIYLGYGCYGVDTAAKKYFSTNVEDLTLEQCAALAALPQAPGVYALLTTEEGEATTELSDGLYANDISQKRRYMTLDLMAEQGYISKKEAEAAKKPITDFIQPGRESKGVSSAFKDYLIETVIKDLMTQYELTKDQASKLVYTKGLHIYSTLNTQAQGVIEKEFRDGSNFPDAIRDDTNVEAAMVMCEVGTGQIKAMAGTRFADGDMLFNRATSPRQPGSSIKPLAVYGSALQRSFDYEKNGQKFQYVKTGYDRQQDSGWGDYITVASYVNDERMHVNGIDWPQNFSKTYTGYNNFRTAIQQSINTCAVKILAQVGLEYSMEKVKEFGVSTVVDDTSQPSNDLNLAALGLGAMTYGATPLDMSLAYATFPNGGVRNSGICYTKVTDSEGKVLLEGKSEETRVLDEGVAFIMTDVLKDVVSYGIARDAAISGVDVGGKTGTTDDTWDIWFDGFTPSYSAALWIGTDDNTPLNATSSVAAALWGNIMGQVDEAVQGEYREMPDDIIIRNGDYFTEGTEPPVIVIKKKEEKKEDTKEDKKTEKTEKKTEKTQQTQKTEEKPAA